MKLLPRFLAFLVVSLSLFHTRRLQSGDQTAQQTSTYPKHCRAGCLICSTKDMCLLCDLSLFYLPHGYDCKLQVIEKCEITNDGVNCLKCKNGFFLGENFKPNSRSGHQKMHPGD